MTDTVRVPREPTEAMLQGACDKHKPGQPMSEDRPEECPRFQTRRRIYAAMLAASPQGDGSSADADTHRAAEGAAVARERDEAVRLLRRIVETKAEDYDERLEAGYIQAFLVSLSRPATTPAEPDWITHDGGPNPEPGKMVDARFRGFDSIRTPPYHIQHEMWELDSDTLRWSHFDNGTDIIAYRVTEGVK